MLAGPLVGGALTQYATWRWCMLFYIRLKFLANFVLSGFYINLPCGGVAAILLLFVSLPQPTRKDAGNRTILDTILKLDPIGFCLFARPQSSSSLALQWGGIDYAWSSATIIGLFCGSFGTLLAFVGWEYHMGENAMIPLSIISRRGCVEQLSKLRLLGWIDVDSGLLFADIFPGCTKCNACSEWCLPSCH